MATITRREADGIILLRFDQTGRSVNVLSADVWRELEAELTEIAHEPPLRGVLLASGKPHMFFAGADLHELLPLVGNEKAVREHMALGARVLRLIESLPCATVAMIEGAALGGGLELALACDYRVMALTPQLKVGFPEISLGLIPGWGGTQRLSRLIGVEETISRLLSGLPYTEEDLPNEYLADELAPVEEMLTIATQLLDVGETDDLRQIKRDPVGEDMLPAKDYLDATREMLNTLNPELLPAGLEMVRVVMEGALMPLDKALELETVAFSRLMGTETARIRIQRFFDERKKS
ncbi:enoyl-CoA hydratase-related protein [Zavarzinella formosa]|uniref:enoyl-CoA hydratase-related protein n=1 Tax=Zavarzinella formosa TaxID=360055 RepID=UPI0002EF2A71|nr:enoyl-CoA hydratase-related protein [Zavarzinella formosa]